MTLLIILAVGYLLPSFVAMMRGHRNGFAIFMLNLFLGWTFLGWVLSLVWACTSNTHRVHAYDRDDLYRRHQQDIGYGRTIDALPLPSRLEDEDDREYNARMKRLSRVRR